MRTPDRALVALAGAAAAVFLALAAGFWIGSNANETTGHVPGWTHLSVAAGWPVLPAVTLLLVLALAVAGRPAAARFLLVSVAGAGILMYAVRIVLQAVGADDDGGKLSDFPSGHTAATTALAGSLLSIVWLDARSRAARWSAGACAAAAVVAVGWARVAGHGHTLLDVLGGVSLGIFWLAVALLVVPPDGSRAPSRRQVLWGLLALGGLGFVFLAALYDDEPLASVDADVAERVARDMPGWAEWLARPFSWLGGWIGVTAIVVVGAVLLSRRRNWVDLGFLLGAVLGSQIVVALLKAGFDRARPHVGSAVPLPSSASFPSGHATTGVACLGAVAILASERLPSRRSRGWLWAVTASLGIGVGVSRVVLNVHYVTDVLAGWCLGLAWLSLCLLVRDAARDRQARPAMPARVPARSSPTAIRSWSARVSRRRGDP